MVTISCRLCNYHGRHPYYCISLHKRNTGLTVNTVLQQALDKGVAQSNVVSECPKKIFYSSATGGRGTLDRAMCHTMPPISPKLTSSKAHQLAVLSRGTIPHRHAVQEASAQTLCECESNPLVQQNASSSCYEAGQWYHV